LVTIPNAAALELTTAMTLEAWVNPSKVTCSRRDVIYKGDDNYYLEGATPIDSSPALGGTYGGANMNLFGASALTAKTWTHLAATYDGTMVRLYVNGAQASSVAQTGSLATSTSPLQIGGDNIYGQYFSGTIDEIRIYNVALTQAQIQSDMNTPVSSLAPAQQIISGVTTGRPTSPIATTQPANLSTAALPQIQTGNSGISCAPKAVTAGGQAKCTIQMPVSPNSAQVRLESSSGQVRVPPMVATRANQSSLTFLASVAPDTKLQTVTIAAALADGQVEDSILVLPPDGPC
jgi:hypothetical protein